MNHLWTIQGGVSFYQVPTTTATIQLTLQILHFSSDDYLPHCTGMADNSVLYICNFHEIPFQPLSFPITMISSIN